MAFYKFGELSNKKIRKIEEEFGGLSIDLKAVLRKSNGGRFDCNGKNPIFVKDINANIQINVLYGLRRKQRENIFYWNDRYGHQIPKDAIIIGDTQNHGFIVCICKGEEKGVYYWDASYDFECSDEICNAYYIADSMGTLFEIAEVDIYEYWEHEFVPLPVRIRILKNYILMRLWCRQKLREIDTNIMQQSRHSCERFTVKWENTFTYARQCKTKQFIEELGRGVGYNFSEFFKEYAAENQYKLIEKPYYLSKSGRRICFKRLLHLNKTWEGNIWDVNLPVETSNNGVDDKHFENTEESKDLYSQFIIFAADGNNSIAINKVDDKVVYIDNNSLKIDIIADDFENFIKGLCDEGELLRRETKIKKAAEDRKPKPIDDINKSEWFDLFSSCLGRMSAIQNNAAKYVIKNRNWNIDFSKGYISFGDDKYPVQFIGSESSINNTWMWGWNNINNFAENVISLPKAILSSGKKWRLDALTTAQFDLDDVFNGHTLSIAACGLSKHDYFYYRAPHDNGAVFVAICNAPQEVFEPVNVNEFVDIVLLCINQYQINHKIFIENFLMSNKTDFIYGEDKKTLIAHFEQNLYITFDDIGIDCRISNIRCEKELDIATDKKTVL